MAVNVKTKNGSAKLPKSNDKKPEPVINGKEAISELQAQREYIKKLQAERDIDLQAQRKFTNKLQASGQQLGLVMEAAFAESIRALGYKSTMYALAELGDNSIQAGAENVHCVLHTDSGETVNAIAVIDDGHGMDPPMLQVACLWGGTHRQNDRTGFGRFGFGGPSACASQGRRFTYYSASTPGTLHAVTIDIDDIANGKLTAADGRVHAPDPKPVSNKEMPNWLVKSLEEHGLTPSKFVGTIVVIEKLDQLSYKMRSALANHLVEGIGVTYRNYLRQVKFTVNSKVVQPVDPLFITPGFRGYDVDDERAVPKDPINFAVTGSDGKVRGYVRVRFSLMSPTFAVVDKTKGVGSRSQNANPRWSILKGYNKGLCILRKGRQIDTIEADVPWFTFRNYDRYWACEIDFDPSLDEEYSVTTSKQQVRLSDRMWTMLENAGVRRVITQMRAEFERMRAQHDATSDEVAQQRRSEAAMTKARKYKRTRPGGKTAESVKESEAAVKREAKRRAASTGMPVDELEDVVRAETEAFPYKVRVEDLPGSPFFRAEQVGSQVVLWLNKTHSFYTHVYAGTNSTPQNRTGMELLLFAIAEARLDSSGDQKRFYDNEVPVWSQTLSNAVEELADMRDPGEEDPADGEDSEQ